MTNGRIKRGVVAFLLFFATILTGCQHKDVYSTDIEEGTYTARLIYQHRTLSSSPSDFSVEISETTLKLGTRNEPWFEGELYASALTSDSWCEYPEMYRNCRYWTEDILDKLMLTENILEANQKYDWSMPDDPDYYYVEYYGIFKLNKKIYMVLQSTFKEYYPERGIILRIWKLEETD